jgi:hypothetical protein
LDTDSDRLKTQAPLSVMEKAAINCQYLIVSKACSDFKLVGGACILSKGSQHQTFSRYKLTNYGEFSKFLQIGDWSLRDTCKISCGSLLDKHFRHCPAT